MVIQQKSGTVMIGKFCQDLFITLMLYLILCLSLINYFTSNLGEKHGLPGEEYGGGFFWPCCKTSFAKMNLKWIPSILKFHYQSGTAHRLMI